MNLTMMHLTPDKCCFPKQTFQTPLNYGKLISALKSWACVSTTLLRERVTAAAKSASEDVILMIASRLCMSPVW
jgi:hypothetical protein